MMAEQWVMMVDHGGLQKAELIAAQLKGFFLLQNEGSRRVWSCLEQLGAVQRVLERYQPWESGSRRVQSCSIDCPGKSKRLKEAATVEERAATP